VSKVFLSTWIFFLSICPVLADQVFLKNGDRLSGTIVKAEVKSDGKELVLHTAYAGDITLKWDAVSGLRSDARLHLELQNGKTAVGAVNTSGGKLEIATRSGTVEAVPEDVKNVRNDAEQAAYDKTLHAGLLQDWKSGLNVGFALTRGNSQTKNLSLAFVGTRQTQRDKLGLYMNSVYATSDTAGAVSSTTANAIGGGARYDHDLRPRIFAFVAADFFSDGLQGLNLRSVAGAGAGFHALKTEPTTLDFLGGLNYTRESYTTLSRNFSALTLGEELMHKIGKSTVMNQRLYFFPNLNSTGEYRGTFDFATVTKISKRLGWQNSFSDIYVTNPPVGKRQNDIILTTGLNLSFGQ
jgi:putative salt-induced outer membrane protein YdiY